MKTRFLTLSVFMMISLSLFAQKDELKNAEKAIKNQDFATAQKELTSAESMMSSMDTKMKAKFYNLKGQAYEGKKDFQVAFEAYESLLAEEKASGKSKYTVDVKENMKKMAEEVNKKANEYYKNKSYDKASDLFHITYKLSPSDTIFFFYSAYSAQLAKQYDKALTYYNKLQEMKYTGITTQYWAVNKSTGVNENLGSKFNRDLFVKSKEYINPNDKKTESKIGDIIKNIAYILKEQGKPQEAILAFEEARKIYPKDVSLILNEAAIYLDLGKTDKYLEFLKLAVNEDPTGPMAHLLFFNLGVYSYDQKKIEEAKQYYQKAIDIKPDYADAYFNYGLAIMHKERAIIDEMYKNLSDFDKYDKLLIKQKEVYKEALPFLEKADQYSRSLNSVQTLMNFYETLGMEAKSKEYRDLYNKLKK